MDFKTKLLTGIILVLCAIIVLQRCNPNINTKINYKDSTHITYDTIPITVKDSGHTQPKEKDSIPYPEYITKYIPDSTSLKILIAQYHMLYTDFSMKRVYDDSIKIDSNGIKGYVHIVDSTQFNQLGKRQFDYKLNYDKIKETVTIDHYIPPSRKLFMGGGLFGSKGFPIYGAEAGLIYLDRKDRLYQFTGKVDMNQQFSIGAGLYWKINLKKK